ncbi:MAG: hypothetical protein HY775_09435 [Acidobacteria bacterium]|nr:hypothetical protein [Acidobacteriota bacterium]
MNVRSTLRTAGLGALAVSAVVAILLLTLSGNPFAAPPQAGTAAGSAVEPAPGECVTRVDRLVGGGGAASPELAVGYFYPKNGLVRTDLGPNEVEFRRLDGARIDATYTVVRWEESWLLTKVVASGSCESPHQVATPFYSSES